MLIHSSSEILIKSWISIQEKLVRARQIVTELRQTHAHERKNEDKFPDFSDKKHWSKVEKLELFCSTNKELEKLTNHIICFNQFNICLL